MFIWTARPSLVVKCFRAEIAISNDIYIYIQPHQIWPACKQNTCFAALADAPQSGRIWPDCETTRFTGLAETNLTGLQNHVFYCSCWCSTVRSPNEFDRTAKNMCFTALADGPQSGRIWLHCKNLVLYCSCWRAAVRSNFIRNVIHILTMLARRTIMHPLFETCLKISRNSLNRNSES